MPGTVRIKITELNPHLICVLCGGYYIDAATIRECLHSFCRTCITKYLETTKYCPICDVMVHKTKPLQYVKSDKNLQDLVYKLVPGLYKDEMKRRRDFYANHTDESSEPPRPSEARGYEDKDRMIYTEDEKISLALELFSDIPEPSTSDLKNPDKLQQRDIRYLQCPAAVSVAHLKKFIRMKFDLSPKYTIDIFHSDEPLKDFFTLMDIAYIYTWRRTAPLRLLYTVYEQITKKRKINGEETSQSHKQPRLEGKDRGDPKGNALSDSRDYSSPESDQGDENSSPDENEQGTKEPKKECDESVDDKLIVKKDESTDEDQKLSNCKNSKISGDKPKLTEKDSVKNIMYGKTSTAPPSLHEQGGKFFSSSFYKRKAAFSGDIETECAVDLTKKTLKKHKDVNTKKIGKEQTVVNGNHFPGYEFTD